METDPTTEAASADDAVPRKKIKIFTPNEIRKIGLQKIMSSKEGGPKNFILTGQACTNDTSPPPLVKIGSDKAVEKEADQEPPPAAADEDEKGQTDQLENVPAHEVVKEAQVFEIVAANLAESEPEQEATTEEAADNLAEENNEAKEDGETTNTKTLADEEAVKDNESIEGDEEDPLKEKEEVEEEDPLKVKEEVEEQDPLKEEEEVEKEVDEETKKEFCNQLKQNMQRVLGIQKPVATEMIIDGKKMKVVKNVVVQYVKKPTLLKKVVSPTLLNGLKTGDVTKVMKPVVASPVPRTIQLVAKDEGEGTSGSGTTPSTPTSAAAARKRAKPAPLIIANPNFKSPMLRTYMRKRAGDEDENIQKATVPATATAVPATNVYVVQNHAKLAQQAQQSPPQPSAGESRVSRRKPELTLLSELSEPESPPPKVYKKRGRKSKAELAEIARLAKEEAERKKLESPDDDDDDSDEDSDEGGSIISPTRTGRVPKPNKRFANYVTTVRKHSTSENERSSDTEVKPKRRGRPPKIKPAEQLVVIVTSNDEDEDEDEEALAAKKALIAQVVKRKRGRPPLKKPIVIIKNDDDDDDEDDDDDIDESTSTKRPKRSLANKEAEESKKTEVSEKLADGKKSEELKSEEVVDEKKDKDKSAEVIENKDKEGDTSLKSENKGEENKQTSTEHMDVDEDPKDNDNVESQNTEAVKPKIQEKSDETAVEEEKPVEKKDESKAVEEKKPVEKKEQSKASSADVKKDKEPAKEVKEEVAKVTRATKSSPRAVKELAKAAKESSTPLRETRNPKKVNYTEDEEEEEEVNDDHKAQEESKPKRKEVTSKTPLRTYSRRTRASSPLAEEKKEPEASKKLRESPRKSKESVSEEEKVEPTTETSKRGRGRPRRTPVAEQNKVNKGRIDGRKRKWETSATTTSTIIGDGGGGGGDAPAKRAKLDDDGSLMPLNITTSNTPTATQNDAPVPDISTSAVEEGAKVADETAAAAATRPADYEGTTTKMYRLLTHNLVVIMKEAMKNATNDTQPGPAETTTCAVCKVHMQPKQWHQHKLREHNNVAWRVGDKPLNLDDLGLVGSILNCLYPKKPYRCDVCGNIKKSKLGFLVHKLVEHRKHDELEALKVQCTECPKFILPSQLVEHEKVHTAAAKKAARTEMLAEMEVAQNDTNTPSKRAAAIKASEKIQEVAKELTPTDGDAYSQKLYCFKPNSPPWLIKKAFGALIHAKGEVSCPFKHCEAKFKIAKAAYDHLKVCEHKLEQYVICKFCLEVFEKIVDIRMHVNLQHADLMGISPDDDFVAHSDNEPDSADNDESDFSAELEDDKKTRKKLSELDKVHANDYWKLEKFVRINEVDNAPLNCPLGICTTTYSKMLDFCVKNYTKQLFANYRFIKSSWVHVNPNYISDYLPSLQKSIGIACNMIYDDVDDNVEYKRYNVFEATIINGTVNIYCGGPISSMAWAPTPFDKPDAEQILAVAISKNHDSQYILGRRRTDKCIIQLWNFGVMDNKGPIEKSPQLELCIAHNFGSIRCMEWCPSGCYEVDGTRLGLLACACTDGNVYCFAIGRSNQLTEKIVKTKPSFKLVAGKDFEMNISQAEEYYPMSLSWTKAEGHNYIAVGYSNGLVAMFNLENSSTMLKTTDENNVTTFYPYRTFKAHHAAVTAIALYHAETGNRFLATGGLDRAMKVWDLRAKSLNPLQIVRRASVYHLVWPVNAISIFCANDDSSNDAYLHTCALHAVEMDYVRNIIMVNSMSAARSISGSDWGALFYMGNDAGEVVGCRYRNMHPFIPETCSKTFICSNVTLVPVDENVAESLSVEENNNFEIVRQYYRLLFQDYKLDRIAKTAQQPRMRTDGCDNNIDYAKFPAEAVTVLATNNNRFSFLFTAVGYNVGVVRVFHSRFLSVR